MFSLPPVNMLEHYQGSIYNTEQGKIYIVKDIFSCEFDKIFDKKCTSTRISAIHRENFLYLRMGMTKVNYKVYIWAINDSAV